MLAVGAHLKGAVAVTVGDQVIVSQHLGDLDSAEGAALLERTVHDLLAFFAVRPELIACDLHPDYTSTRLAERLSEQWHIPLTRVQHHHAHVAACVAEHAIEGEVLGLAWDGTGYGEDGTIWGGEALLVSGGGSHRFASLRPFSLPGGDAASRDPRRSALGLLHELGLADRYASEWLPAFEATALVSLLRSGRTPRTTSMGRLFDAVSALAGFRERMAFEGQAAMALEFAVGEPSGSPYPLPLREAGGRLVADWEPMIREALLDAGREAPSLVATRFHAGLAELAVATAKAARRATVVLSGGCFQNLQLARRVRSRLESEGFRVYSPRLFPPNDGGIALGQVLVAARRASNP